MWGRGSRWPRPTGSMSPAASRPRRAGRTRPSSRRSSPPPAGPQRPGPARPFTSGRRPNVQLRTRGWKPRGGDQLVSAVEHRFGPYGGQYVPETLMPALAQLERGWEEAWADQAFRAELDALLRDYAGRPTPLYETRRLSEAAGGRILLKREDLLHTGAHKLNNALGQALL